MNIVLMTVGNTKTEYIISGIEEYQKRLRRYIPFEIETIPDVKNTRSQSEQTQKDMEGQMILGKLSSSDFVVLLDEKGKEFSSMQFAEFMSKQMGSGRKRLVFVIGGPYGFSKEVYDRGDFKLSLSQMTFNHEMVRLFFIEQIYRSQTILRGEPYHHQ